MSIKNVWKEGMAVVSDTRVRMSKLNCSSFIIRGRNRYRNRNRYRIFGSLESISYRNHI